MVLNPAIWFVLGSGLIAIVLTIIAGRYRKIPTIVPFRLFMLGAAIWSLGNALEFVAQDFQTKYFFSNIQYAGIVLIPAAWLVFVLEYVGYKSSLTPRRRLILIVEPIIVLLLVVTSSWQPLFKHSFAMDYSGEWIRLTADPGPLFWVHTAYSYIIILVGTLILFRAMWRYPVLYRGQSVFLLIAAFTPWVANILYIIDFEPIPDLDLTPIAFTITGLAIAWSIYRFQLLDIMPVTRAAVFDHMDDAIIVLDNRQRILDVNEAALKNIAFNMSEVLGMFIEDVFPQFSEELPNILSDQIYGQQRISINRQGQSFTYGTKVNTLRNSRNELEGYVIALRDISQQQQIEDELSALFTTMDDLILVADSRGRCLKIAPTRQKILQMPAQDVIDTNLQDYCDCEPAIYVQPLIDEALEAGTTQAMECRLQNHNPPTWLHITFSPMGENQIVCVARDITARKQADQELAAHRSHLEEMVIERTSQFQQLNDQLEIEIAEKRSVEANLSQSLKEKDVMLKEIHHRVKNNMQVMTSLLSLQASQVEDVTIEALFMDSQNRIHSMALIHEQLYQSYDLARIDFEEYISELTNNLLRSYHSPGVNFHIEVEDIHLDVDVAIPCGLIINELVSNSLKHAFPNSQGGTIRIVMRVSDQGEYILTVQDDGIGFPEGLNHLETDSLGLKLVDGLSHQLNGTIELLRDNGTVVTVRFWEQS